MTPVAKAASGKESRSVRLAILFSGLLLCPCVVQAAPEEIQVYIDDMDDPGEVGLDTHINYVATGQSTGTPSEDSVHRLRITPEFSYGLTPDLEAGLYLPLTTIDRSGHFHFGGAKVRLKYVLHPKGDRNVWYGANLEVGRVDRRLDVNPWNSELKGILGTRQGKWLLALNSNIDFVISGPQPEPASLELTTKVSYQVSRHAAIGFETYNGVGPLRHLGQFGASEQSIYAAGDFSLGKWDLNLGIGRGFGSNPDRLIVKAIVGVPIEGLFRK